MKKFLFLLIFLSMGTLSVVRPAFAVAPPDPSDTPKNVTNADLTQYQLLAPLPLDGAGSAPTDQATIVTYIPAAIKLITGLAGGMAVLLVMIGGIQYITSASGMGKSDGKERIKNALIGLLLVIGAYTILYTVNPALVQLNLNITQIPAAAEVTAPAGCTGDGCIPDSSGVVPPCANCVPVTPVEFPQKAPGIGCANPVCSVSATIAAKLENLTSSFGSTNWQVTEMYPPTVVHLVGTAGYSCHDIGTCVDAALTVSNPSPALIAAFLTAVQKAGFSSYVYEACDNTQGFSTARLTQLKNEPSLKGFNIKCEQTTQGENVHLNQ